MPEVADDVDEHPIIFYDWSINRILAGEKTQTRRVVKPQPNGPTKGAEQAGDGSWYWVPVHGTAQTAPGSAFKCPYGQPGDVLWVREAFRLPDVVDNWSPSKYMKKWRDGEDPWVKYEAADNPEYEKFEWGRKRPSIHMPRELCRLRLRVEDVHVERVQEISSADAHAEGIARRPKRSPNGDVIGEMDPVGGFKKKWNDIHGDGAWVRNDWVWVITFSPITE